MKKAAWGFLMAGGLSLGCGCVVRSLAPWLSPHSRVAEPSLVGVWHDPSQHTTVFFAPAAPDAPAAYSVLLVHGANETSRFLADLHRVEDHLLLMVGPGERTDLGALAELPGYLLFRADVQDNTMKLHEIRLTDFAERLQRAQLACQPGGSETDGFVLCAPAAEMEVFLRRELTDPEFFKEPPLYTFQRISAGAPGAGPASTTPPDPPAAK